MIQWRMFRYSDLILWGGIVSLLLIGSFSLFSSSHSILIQESGSSGSLLSRHFLSILLALCVASPFLYVDYRHLRWLCWFGYGLSIFLLILVEFIGREVGGSARWLTLGPLSIQPSEIAKIVVLICVAQFLASRPERVGRLEEVAVVGAIVLPPALLILQQPDLGTALTLAISTFGLLLFSSPKLPIMLFLLLPIVSIITRLHVLVWVPYLCISTFLLFSPELTPRIRWPLIGWNFAAGAFVPLLWQFLKPYQQLRILTFLNPGLDPHGAGYQSLQGQIAIGSGGLFGRGYLHGTQTQMSFVPQQTTDFIFTALGEEWGLLGSAILLLIFWVICIRVLKIAVDTPNRFGELLAGGFLMLIGVQITMNLAMTLGLFPVVGVPLPFISLGGTSLLVNLIAISILQSIAMRSNQIFF
jgi:rod shape determining protein RodA